MNIRSLKAVIRKDLLGVIRSRGMMIPMIIVPLIFFVLIPVLASLAPELINMPGASGGEVEDFLSQMPAGMQQALQPYTAEQSFLVVMVVYMFAPFFLIVPLMVSSVIAADSFAGEKERKTIEALLYSPLSDRELYFGKLLTGWIPALVVSLVGFVIYTLAANLAGWSTMGQIYFPTWMWVVLVLWVSPAAAGLGLSSMVLVSSRVKGFQEAQQLGGVIVLPLVVLFIAQSTGVMYFNLLSVFLLGAVIWIIDAALFWWGAKTFRRERMVLDN